MLQGFNHNIRYRERVFHVQTEDSGLGLPRIVTQLFLDGQILAYEKTTYEDILARNLAPEARDSAIRDVMQHQHKGLMRNLVRGSYDDIIASHVGIGPPSSTPLRAESPPIPMASPEGLIPEPARDESGSPTSPGFAPVATPIDFALAAAGLSPEEPSEGETQSFFRGSSAAEAQQVRQFAFENPRPPQPTTASREHGPMRDQGPRFGGSLEMDFSEAPPVPPARRTSSTGTEESTPDLIPPASDTLVDFGLPAGLRERLRSSLTALRGQREGEGGVREGASVSGAGAAETPPSPYPLDADLDLHSRRDAAGRRDDSRPPPRVPPRDDRTLIDIGPADLRWKRAQERDAQRGEGPKMGAADPSRQELKAPTAARGPGAASSRPKKAKDESRPNILVVERSLDEVILSYLSDDE